MSKHTLDPATAHLLAVPCGDLDQAQIATAIDLARQAGAESARSRLEVDPSRLMEDVGDAAYLYVCLQGLALQGLIPDASIHAWSDSFASDEATSDPRVGAFRSGWQDVSTSYQAHIEHCSVKIARCVGARSSKVAVVGWDPAGRPLFRHGQKIYALFESRSAFTDIAIEYATRHLPSYLGRLDGDVGSWGCIEHEIGDVLATMDARDAACVARDIVPDIGSFVADLLDEGGWWAEAATSGLARHALVHRSDTEGVVLEVTSLRYLDAI